MAPVNTGLLVAAAPLHAHVHGAAESTSGGFPLLASVGLYVLVVLVGSLVAPTLSRVDSPGRARRWLVGVLAFGYAGTVIGQVARHELSAVIACGIGTALAVALLALRRNERVEQAVAAVVLLAAQIPVVGAAAGYTHLVAVLGHLAAASVWVGGVLHVTFVTATAGRTAGGRAARRFSVFAGLSTVSLVASGAVLMLVHHIGRFVLASSTYGHVLLAKMAALSLAVVIGFTMRRRASAEPSRAWPRLLRAEALVLSSALGLGAVLVGLADPEPAFAVAAPGLGHLRMGDESGTLFLVRRTPTSGVLMYAAGDVDAPAVRIDDGSGEAWKPSNDGAQVRDVSLHDGTGRFSIGYEHKTVHAKIRAAEVVTGTSARLSTGDREDEIQFALGRSLALAAGGKTSVANVALTCGAVPSAADQGRAFGAGLRQLGVRTVAVRGDGSARARGFTSALRAADLTVQSTADTVVLAGGSASALVSLGRLVGKASNGIYLAPWLLDGNVLSATRRTGLPLLAVGSVADPMAPLADRYRGLLDALATYVPPTESGLLGFLSVAAPDDHTATSLRIYAAAPVGFLPGVLDVGHQHRDGGWFPSGTLAPITNPQPITTRCPNSA